MVGMADFTTLTDKVTSCTSCLKMKVCSLKKPGAWTFNALSPLFRLRCDIEAEIFRQFRVKPLPLTRSEVGTRPS